MTFLLNVTKRCHNGAETSSQPPSHYEVLHFLLSGSTEALGWECLGGQGSLVVTTGRSMIVPLPFSVDVRELLRSLLSLFLPYSV